MESSSFKMTNSLGEEIFHITPELARTSFRSIKMRGRAQALKSLQTEQIFSLPSTNMKIASPTQNLQVYAANQLDLVSSVGNMDVTVLNHIQLEARNVSTCASILNRTKPLVCKKETK
jgi:hypothetical protein